MSKERGNFGGRLATVLVMAGSAVGLGNVWRFPYEVGRHGGAAFLLVYIACIIFFGLPLMVSEMAVGRHAQSNTVRAYGQMGGSRHWHLVGLLGVLTGTLILCYYGVVAGWACDYLLRAGVNGFTGQSTEEYQLAFTAFVANPWKPIVCMVLFMTINLAVIVAGVKKGIEKGSKIMMPLLFVLVVLLAGGCIMLPGASSGLLFLFKPNFSALTASALLSAIGQCFFSLSIGMGCICTYASYMRRDSNLVTNGAAIVIIDTVVALLMGVIIFSTAFSVGIQPDAGSSLVFITLPSAFSHLFAHHLVLGYFFSLIFYLLLFIAMLTSAMSLLEVLTTALIEEFHVRRSAAAIGGTVFCCLVGAVCSLSLGIWSGHTIFGMTLFDCFDSGTAKVLLPLCGLLIALYTGWVVRRQALFNEVTNYGSCARHFFSFYHFVLRYVVPVIIIVLFLSQIGLF